MSKNWRDDTGITSEDVYVRKFSWYPIKLFNDEKIHWKSYYSVYRYYPRYIKGYYRKEFIHHISEIDYIVLKLSGKV